MKASSNRKNSQCVSQPLPHVLQLFPAAVCRSDKDAQEATLLAKFGVLSDEAVSPRDPVPGDRRAEASRSVQMTSSGSGGSSASAWHRRPSEPADQVSSSHEVFQCRGSKRSSPPRPSAKSFRTITASCRSSKVTNLAASRPMQGEQR